MALQINNTSNVNTFNTSNFERHIVQSQVNHLSNYLLKQGWTRTDSINSTIGLYKNNTKIQLAFNGYGSGQLLKLIFSKLMEGSKYKTPFTIIDPKKKDLFFKTSIFLKKYNGKLMFLKMTNGHGGEQVEPVFNQQDIDELLKRQDLQKCTELILELGIDNPLLYHGRKFDFRVYYVIVRINDKYQALIYSNWVLNISSKKHVVNNQDKTVLITNYQITANQKNNLDRMKMYSDVTSTDLNVDKDILTNNVIKCISDFSSRFIPYLKSKNKAKSDTMQYYLFGLDVICNQKLEPYIIECNCKPGYVFKNYPAEVTAAKLDVINDMIKNVILSYANTDNINLTESKFISVYEM